MRYTAEVGGHSWSRGPSADVESLTAGKQFAESYGTTADWCHVYNSRGVLMAAYHRIGNHWQKGGRT